MIILKDEPDCVQPEFSQLVVVQRPDIVPIDNHLAGIGAQDAGKHAEHRGLAAAGRADNEQHLAKMSDQCDIIHGRHPGLAFAKPFGQTRLRRSPDFPWVFMLSALIGIKLRLRST